MASETQLLSAAVAAYSGQTMHSWLLQLCCSQADRVKLTDSFQSAGIHDRVLKKPCHPSGGGGTLVSQNARADTEAA
jgi:hypothetical protein